MPPTTPQASTLHATQPAHRVLFIPELLDIIFNFLDRKTNARNACVCKQWSDIALDVVWKEVDNLIDIFSFLKPIRQDGLVDYAFETLPEARDWYRFEKYASRVRSLSFRSEWYDLDIIPLLDEIARTRTSLEIFPNMHSLEWLYNDNDQMERCKLFLHRRLRHLAVTAPSEPVPRPDFYTDLCARAPHLQTIKLLVQFPGDPIESDIQLLVRNLPELKNIILPEFHFTSGAIEALSRAPNLRVMDFIQDIKLGYGKQSNVDNFCPVLQEGAFPSLRELSLSARVDHLDTFFRSEFAPINITSLYVNSYVDQSPSEVHTFLLTLSQQCQRLSKLFIQLYNKSAVSEFGPDKQLSYETIKPILSFSKLTSFDLIHKYPLRITLDEIEDFATRWPTLESLMLNAEPLFLGEDAFTLDLRALQPFARHCPRLRRLGLYINASKLEIPSVHSPVDHFTSLEVLAVGTSQASDTGTVATFLSRICPPGCQLEIGITWPESILNNLHGPFLSADLRSELHDRGVAWQTIEKLLPALIQLRREEKERSRALQEEVEDLRVRTRLLMDKEDVKTKDSCVIG